MRKYNRFTSIIFLAILNTLLLGGSEDRKGTSAASQLLLPVGARDIAMAGATAPITSGIEALFWNPAGIARSKHNADVMVSQMNYIADIGLNFFAVGGNFPRFGSIAFSIKTISFGDIPVTTESVPDGSGATYSPNFFTAGVTYARSLSDRIFVGASLNLVNEEITRTAAQGTSFTVGIQYHDFLNLKGFNLGVVLKDLGTEMVYDGTGLLRQGETSDGDRGPSFVKLQAASFDLPTSMELGLSYSLNLTAGKLQLSGVFQNNNYSNDELRLGGEFSFRDMVYLRVGNATLLEFQKEEDVALFGPSFGGGLRFNLTGLDVEVDYAFKQVSNYFKDNQVLSLQLGF